MSPDDPNVRVAVLGRQIEHFLGTDIGGYIVKRATQQSEAAFEEFKKVDPFDGPAVAAVQRKANVADGILEWMGDAVAAGQSATEILKEGLNG